MSTVKSKVVVITVGGKDISLTCKKADYKLSATVVDNTGFGVDDKIKEGSLRDAKLTCSGVYDSAPVTGSRAALLVARGTTVACTYKVEGTGAGRPLDSFNAVLSDYTESSAVDTYILWSVELEISGPIVTTIQ